MKELDFSYETYKKERKAALIYAISTMRKVLDEYREDYTQTLFTIPDPDDKEEWDNRDFELYSLSDIISKLELAIEEIEKIV